MKLNGWQRIGVVASALWAIGATYYERTAKVSEAQRYYRQLLEWCEAALGWTPACVDDATAAYRRGLAWDPGTVQDIVASALLVTVLMVWVLAPLIVKIARWVKAGF